jgi:2-oxoisovalerate dehydrogenase E2 component (dihydrolipoyl transacylase)
MSSYIFRVPDIGEGTAEVELVAWHVNIGDLVEEDQPVADLMSEKATVETPSPIKGRVVALLGTPGEMLAVGAPLLELDVADGSMGDDAAQIVVADQVESAAVEAAVPTGEPGHKPVASPAVRARAAAAGVDLRDVKGSGPEGRITQGDLDADLGPSVETTAATDNLTTEIPVIGLRRRIAHQMQEAKRRIPHFSYVEEVDVTELEELRAHLNDGRRPGDPKLTPLPFIIRALVAAIVEFPQMNARYDDEAEIIHRHAALHLGLATQTDNGLIVPVIRNAQALDLNSLAREIARLAEATRAGTARREELSGSTLTLTSLGPLGGLSHTPVINHPEVAIIGPNKIIERPVVRHGSIVARRMMNISASFDHRVIDGFDGAAFIQKIRGLLEHPALLFMAPH